MIQPKGAPPIVVGAAALIVATGGVAAAALPEALAAVDVGVDVTAVAVETAGELGTYGQGLADASTALNGASTVLSAGSTADTCFNEGLSANCVAGIVLTGVGAATTVAGGLTSADEALRSAGYGLLGFAADLAGLANFDKTTRSECQRS